MTSLIQSPHNWN